MELTAFGVRTDTNQANYAIQGRIIALLSVIRDFDLVKEVLGEMMSGMRFLEVPTGMRSKCELELPG